MPTIAQVQAPAQAEPVHLTDVTVGVDTHRDVHVADARDQLGRRMDTRAAMPLLPPPADHVCKRDAMA